jgi:multidrug resistance protein, MATE family
MQARDPLKEPYGTGVREVMVMSWPIILGSLSYTVMEFVDKWMVSKLGTEPLAAVGAAGIWSFTISTVLLGIIGCVSTFAAQSLGRDKKADCARYTWQGIYLSIGAALLALLFFPLSRPLFQLMRHGDEVMRLELIYFRIRLLGYLPMACGTALAAFFQAVNRPRIPMYMAIVGNANNILFNYLLIFGAFGFPRMGLAGAATATIISQFMQTILLLGVFVGGPIHREFGSRAVFHFDPGRFRELVRIGLPSGVSMFLDIANWSIFTSFVVGYFGATQLAAHNIAISFMHLCFMPAVAMNQGIAAIVGQWLGRGDIRRAKARTYTALRIAMGYMTGMGLIFAIFGGTLIETMFSKDPEVIQLGHRLLILAAVFQAFDATNIICMGALRGAGDTRWMMWAMFFMAYLLFLPLATILAFPLKGEAFGAWIGATVFISALSVLLFLRFHGEGWRDIEIFTEAAPLPPSSDNTGP